MKPSLRIALTTGVLALLVLAFLLLRPKPEPVHENKPLSDWLIQLISAYPRMDPEAVEALNTMGETAVRSLIAAAENEDSPLKIKLLQHSDTLPILGDIFETKFWDRYIALKALAVMGTNASAAIPNLQKIERSNEPMLATAATAALVAVQNQSIEAIAADCFDYQNTNSSRAFGILLQLGPQADSAIPKVLEELHSTNDRIRLRAATVLKHVGINSPICLPVFTNMLNDANILMRATGLDALANCGDKALTAAPSVAAMLDDPASLCRSSALIYFLRVVPPDAFEPYRATVFRTTKDVDQTVRLLAERVLQEKETAK